VGERRFAALVEGDVARPLQGVEELGAATPAELLASPPVADETIPLAGVTLRPVVPRPGKIVCVGLNYKAHVDEGVFEVPDYPALFPKYADALVGAGQPVLVPPESEAVDYEAELALVIGERARDVPLERALDVVAGLTCLNDVSARDVQFAEGQWTRGKSFDSFCPVGPEVVPVERVGDPQALRVRCRVNGETMQDASTADMIFGVAELVSFASRATTLEPGDVIATGTPPGVALGQEDPRYLRAGDVVEVEIDGIGILRNPVVAAADGLPVA
jgi:2-keto-4-pentenoate hydratase/2-oxohepta-3-ene-1,7-dioic acid hydratase in catechol pathway